MIMESENKKRKTISPFDLLPDELLLTIFKQMNINERKVLDNVCVRFQYIINHYFKDDYFIDVRFKDVSVSALCSIYRNDIKYLDLAGSSLNIDLDLEELKKMTQGLKYLNVIGTQPKDAVLELLSACYGLEKLSLNQISGIW